MASAEPAPAAMQTVVLRVSIHCHGCKKKVRKVLKSVEGVQNVTVDGAMHKVTVTGTVDAGTLIKRLQKSGKQAGTWCKPAPVAKDPEAAPAPAPEAQPVGDGGKYAAAAAAADKKPAAKGSEKKPEKEAAGGSEKKPEAEEGAESKKEGKEEAKSSDDAKKNGGESEAAEPTAKGAEPAKEAVAAAAAKEASNDDAVDEAKKKSKSRKPEGAGEAKPFATAERTLSAPPPKHAYEEYQHPYYPPQPVMSYHMAQPRSSVSYYAPQPQPAYSMQQPQRAYSMEHPQRSYSLEQPLPAYAMDQPQPQPMQQWSPSYLYTPYPHTAPEPYYHDYYSPPGTHAPPPIQDSYRLFDDENPNSCSVM